MESATKAVKYWQQRALVGAWGRWRDVVEEKAAQRAKLEGALARLMLRELSGAWNTWMENVLLAHKRNLAVARWANSTLVGAFEGWLDAVAYMAETRFKLEGALRRMTLRGLSGAWNTWTEAVAYVRETRFKLEGALRRMTLRGLSGAWNTWMENVLLSHKSKLALGRWTNSCMAAAWERWMEHMYNVLQAAWRARPRR